MQKLISRVCCLFFVVLVIAACLPFSAFAVDPVSAGVMANAFAQAIAAYGASNGVAMTFDVASTDGIGEAVHDLWKEFRNGTQDADDYATLAAALFPELYYKASAAVGAASDVYTVGYNISSTYAEEFDNFYNWLLSGPAEMVKVDNEYYQFSSAQIGSNASSIVVGTFSGFPDQPIPVISSPSDAALRASGLYIGRGINPSNSNNNSDIYISSNQSDTYAFLAPFPSSTTTYYVYFVCLQPFTGSRFYYRYNNPSYKYGLDNVTAVNVDGFYRASTNCFLIDYFTGDALPVYNDVQSGTEAALGYLGGTLTGDSIGVKASTNTGVAEFPDTADPNYDALHRAKEIPSSIPWDDALYGDGSGTLTDAQKEAIAGGVDGVIAEDGELTLAGEDAATDEPGTDDPPSSDPDDYVVPGLADIFPFCIPFDIYNFLSALAASPVAPHFTATLDFPEAVGGTQTIDIDFDSPTWNQLAQLLRLLELLAFIIGLALLTRSMFIRG